MRLPTSALWRKKRDTLVWVLDKVTMTVKSQVVQIAAIDGNEVVVTSGLQPGMLVVSAGLHALASGDVVTLYQAPAKTALPVSVSSSVAASASDPARPATK